MLCHLLSTCVERRRVDLRVTDSLEAGPGGLVRVSRQCAGLSREEAQPAPQRDRGQSCGRSTLKENGGETRASRSVRRVSESVSPDRETERSVCTATPPTERGERDCLSTLRPSIRCIQRSKHMFELVHRHSISTTPPGSVDVLRSARPTACGAPASAQRGAVSGTSLSPSLMSRGRAVPRQRRLHGSRAEKML
jgi:hypothetical protein